MKYRKEIDGLRALAVIPVLMFHAGIPGFNGGYIGVDIFFVISGYLITSIILEGKRQKTFSISNFYERRARRILPALTIVLLFSTIAAYIFMPATHLKSYSLSLASAGSFVSNIFFFFDNDYFSTLAETKPLLHTWSLAVEEQYYLIFPIIISTLWFCGERFLKRLIICLFVLSLFYSHHLLFLGAGDQNFYSSFSRAWEILVGSILAFYISQIKPLKKINAEALCILGIFLISYSIVFFNKNTPFPSLYTLVPIIGTAILIIYCNQETTVGKILSFKVLTYIGLISYSLYLWHQPILAFLRLKTIGTPSTLHISLALLLSFILANFSYKIIERPFRNKNFLNRKKIFKYSLITLFIIISVGLLGFYNKGFPNRFKSISYADTIISSPLREKCHTVGLDYLKPKNACKYFKNKITWAALGDSHIVEPSYALAKKLEQKKQGVLHLSFSSCVPIINFETTPPGCRDWLIEAMNLLEENSSIENILIGFRYSSNLYGDHAKSFPILPNQNPSRFFKEQHNQSDEHISREVYWQEFSEIINRLLKSNKKVYIIYPIPELPVHIDQAVTAYSVFGNKTMVDLEQSTTKEFYLKRNNFILDKLDQLPYGKTLHAIKPYSIFCKNNYCPAIHSGKALYFDDDHLSTYGAELLLSKLTL